MNGRKAIAVIAATGAQRLGTEVVNADIDNSESLKKAFERAYAAFCITFFTSFKPLDP